MRLWLAAAIIAVAWVLAVVLYVESNGIDCYPNCSASQDAAGIVAFTVLPVVFVLVVIAALVQSWRTRSRRRRARPE
jgi:membrane protein YdbS with pleckstrin-like domain